jgi:hypothetical protein
VNRSILFVTAGISVLGCHRSEDAARQAALQRELGRAYFEEGRFQSAARALKSVLESSEATAQDHINAAACEVAEENGDASRAAQLLRRALLLDSNQPAVPYLSGILARRKEAWSEALGDFEKALAFAPADLPAQFHRAHALEKLGRAAEAAEQYKKIIGPGFTAGGSWYLTALYALGSLWLKSDSPAQKEEGLKLLRQHRDLRDKGAVALSVREIELGDLGKVKVPRPDPAFVPSSIPRKPPRFEVVEKGLFADAGPLHLLEGRWIDAGERQDILAAGEKGILIGLQKPEVRFEVLRLDGGNWTRALAADVDNSGRMSFLFFGPRAFKFLAATQSGWEDQSPFWPAALALLDAAWVDYDHDGDLDLLAATPEGLALLRNQGRAASDKNQLVFERLSSIPGWPQGAYQWVAWEDFDADNDVDFLAGGGSPTVLLSSLRQAGFQPLAPAQTGLPESLSTKPWLMDFDHDGLPDLLFPGVPSAQWCRNQGRGAFFAPQSLPALNLTSPPLSSQLADLNLDGESDLAWVGSGQPLKVLFGPLVQKDPAPSLFTMGAGAGRPFAFADLDGDGDPDWVQAGETGADIYRSSGQGLGRPLRLSLQGRKDNRQAVGARVEVRAGPLYQRQLSPGGSLVLGLGTSPTANIVRITWPNGVVQQIFEPDLSQRIDLIQKEGLVGSCPFLYAWNGHEYRFVTDILGCAPLGLPTSRGGYAIPDPDEFLRLGGEQLEPAQGEYRVQITEELRETAYLDRASLWVVDHPEDITVYPEERFTFPPFPPPRIHTVRDARPLVRALGSDGRDWSKQLEKLDGWQAAPFEPLPPQFLGLATPHHLELHLPPEAAGAGRVRLVLTGWFYWTQASVSVALQGHPEHRFTPPELLVPGPAGSWVSAGPPVGCPAGKTKTMMLDVTQYLNRRDLRLRLASSLRLYWDQILVALDAGDAPLEITRLDPVRAELSFHGFSRRLPGVVDGAPEHDQPERFLFHQLEDEVRWNQPKGWLTRYGDVLPLVTVEDDQLAILGPGDALDLRFSASSAPPRKAGTSRTYLLYLVGWDKDGDLNVAHGDTVEPLPFHRMSGYPFAKGESYPETEALRKYQKEWNTRPGRVFVSDMAIGPAASPPGK